LRVNDYRLKADSLSRRLKADRKTWRIDCRSATRPNFDGSLEIGMSRVSALPENIDGEGRFS
jgi:hypothetical protein